MNKANKYPCQQLPHTADFSHLITWFKLLSHEDLLYRVQAEVIKGAKIIDWFVESDLMHCI